MIKYLRSVEEYQAELAEASARADSESVEVTPIADPALGEAMTATASVAAGLATAVGGGDSSGMDPRVDGLEQRIGRVEEKIDDLIKAVAGLPDKWTLVITVVTTGLAVAAIVISMQANMLSSFQAGLSAVQTGIAARPAEPSASPAPPVTFNLTIPTLPPATSPPQ